MHYIREVLIQHIYTIFWRFSERPLTPPPFWKIYLEFLETVQVITIQWSEVDLRPNAHPLVGDLQFVK